MCLTTCSQGRDTHTPLSQLPFLRDIIDEYRAISVVFKHYSVLLEDEYMKAKVIDDRLVHRIACAKAEIVNFAIDATEKLKKVTGSYALFQESPFGSKTDMLYILRFAEGDSNILQQKMTRDSLKAIGGMTGLLGTLLKIPVVLFQNKNGEGILRASLLFDQVRLGVRMALAKKSDMMRVWMESHLLVTIIARKMSTLTILDTLCSKMNGVLGTKEMTVFRKCYMTKM